MPPCGTKIPDRVPISPRTGAWLLAEYGNNSVEQEMKAFPDNGPDAHRRRQHAGLPPLLTREV